jgi:hypothetical protein
MKEIKCDECGKFLFETNDTSNGVIGCRAEEKGFVYKNACLFSKEYSSLYFCNTGCAKEFYRKNIPTDEKMNHVLKEMRDDIPRMAKDVCDKMAKISELIKKQSDATRR